MSSDESRGGLPPRVLLIMPEQWPRALLRAALRETGYDALGAPSVTAGLRYRAVAEGRGLVALIVVDQAAVGDPEASERLMALRHRHRDPPLVLLTSATAPAEITLDAAHGVVRRLRRPASLAELIAAVQSALPLEPGAAHPLDR